MELMMSGLYATRGMFLLFTGTKGVERGLVGKPELELAERWVLRSRDWNPARSSAEFDVSIAFSVTSVKLGHFCNPKSWRSLRDSVEMGVECAKVAWERPGRPA